MREENITRYSVLEAELDEATGETTPDTLLAVLDQLVGEECYIIQIPFAERMEEIRDE